MKATDVLSEEHRVIERVIATLETGSWLLSQNEPIRPEFFILASDFIKGFADGCHHVKEEGVLFKSMIDNGMPAENSPVAVMLYEHEMGRKYTRGMREAAIRLQNGDQSASADVVFNAKHYAALLREHIGKEDTILFPMANQMIPVDQHDAIWDGFEHVEHEETGEGVHEKYLALAMALEKEISRD
jgi:hemerythrin-like domain-containing protein